MISDGEGFDARRKKLFIYASNFGLTRDERIELSEMLLRRDITSWNDLSESQVLRLLDAFEGAALLHYLTQQRAQVRT